MTRLWHLMLLLLCLSCTAARSEMSGGYEHMVSVDDLHPLSLSWNQVHFLVRQSLWDIDQLAHEHERFYEELHHCFGLEKCMKQANMVSGPPQSNRELGAGALLQQIRKQRLQELLGQHAQISASVDSLDQQFRHQVHGQTFEKTHQVYSGSTFSRQHITQQQQQQHHHQRHHHLQDDQRTQSRGRGASHDDYYGVSDSWPKSGRG